MHLPFIAHIHACQMYVTIMCMRLKCTFHFITELIVPISVQDDGVTCGSTSKGKLRELRGSLANDIPSCAIEQANQEVRQDDRHSQHASDAYKFPYI